MVSLEVIRNFPVISTIKAVGQLQYITCITSI